MKKKPAKSAPKKTARRVPARGGALARPKGEASLALTAGAREVWPSERDVLFRPDRFKYVRKLIKPDGCVFCGAAAKKPSFERLCVHQSAHSMVVINKFPYNSGHLLVLPKRHCGHLLELEADEYGDLMQTLRLAFAAIEELYRPAGLNVGLNHGAVAGAGIPEHLHFHLVPRWAGDLNFFPLIAETKVVIETLEQTWERFRSHFLSHEESHA